MRDDGTPGGEPEEIPMRLHFKPDFNIGNVITLLVMCGGFVYGYSALTNKVDALITTVAKLEATDAKQQVQVDNLRDLSTIRQIDISSKIIRIETILERLEGKFDRNIRTDFLMPNSPATPRP